MASKLRLVHALGLLSILTLASAAQTQDCLGSKSSDSEAASSEVNAGVDSYKDARYAEAIDHFQKATKLDPCLTMARAYLATAQAQTVVPGLDTPDNLKTANESIENFKLVLLQNPHDVNSLRQVAALYFNTKRFDEARDWQKKVLIEDPGDSAAAYTIGVIDWTQAHAHALSALAEAGLQDDGEGNRTAPPEVLASIRRQNSDLVAEAMQYLERALANRPNYDDAMSYINLVYRRKADVDYQNPALRDEDVAKAKEWANKAMQTRKENEEKNESPNP